MSTEKHYWLRVNRYGFGWGLPSSWGGWLFILVSLAVLVPMAIRLISGHPFLFALVLGATTLLFVRVVHVKGQPLSDEPKNIG
jgi:hypothetical protein